MEDLNTILIENLHNHIDISDLCNEFKKYGLITTATVDYDDAMEPLGTARVTFLNYTSAEKAITYKRKDILGYSLKVSICTNTQDFVKIFVKDINPLWTKTDLITAFEHFDEVIDANISETNHNSNGYGFVEFKTHEGAAEAVKAMNNRIIDDFRITVQRYQSKYERDYIKKYSLNYAKERLIKTAQKNNLHIKNIPMELRDGELLKLFVKFGEITSLKIARNKNGSSRGFGFVCFSNEENARKAMKKMQGYQLNDKKLEINFKEDNEARKHYNSLKQNDCNHEEKNWIKGSKSQSLDFLPHPLLHEKHEDKLKISFKQDKETQKQYYSMKQNFNQEGKNWKEKSKLSNLEFLPHPLLHETHENNKSEINYKDKTGQKYYYSLEHKNYNQKGKNAKRDQNQP